ncbi:MAG: hypothetical protein IKK10_03280 [Clostridia bacterium]|nr:hypothetical protein [Clostridia bacterium]
MKRLGKNQQLLVNMIAALVSFGVNGAISFFIIPFVKENVGDGAYGFINLANNFVQYAYIIAVALNSMASRFITMRIYENDYEGAKKYFNSVLFSNIILAVIFAVPSVFIIAFLEKIINIPLDLVADVKLLFTFIFSNFLLTIISSVFGSATYIRNKLYLTSMVTITTSLLRGILLLLVYSFLPSYVFYMGLVALMMTCVTCISNTSFTRRLVPELKISRKYFDIKAIKELLMSGIWNTVMKLGQTLLDSLDLLITNLFISAVAMDVLAIAKTVPVLISSVMSSITGVFAPNFNITYAQKKYDVLVKDIRQAIKIMGAIINIPIAILTVFGYAFFELWVPTEDTRALQILSLLTISKLIVSGSIDCMSSIFTVTNKLKANAFAVLVSGVVSVAATFLLVMYTDLGIFAVAGVSSVCSLLRNLCFTVPYSARCLNLKWYTFYKDVAKSVLSYLLMIAIGFAGTYFLSITSWMQLIIYAVIFGVICLLVSYFVIMNKNERMLVKSKLLGKFLKSKK